MPETGKTEFIKVDGLWQTEIIRDPAVIRAYVRGRQALEEEATLADSLAPTGDADKDKRAKKRYVYFSLPYKGTLMFTFFLKKKQTRGRNCSNEEKSRETAAQKEC